MKLEKVINLIPSLNDLKRIASAWVRDHRHFDKNELIKAMVDTIPQYHYEDNVLKSLEKCLFNDNRNVRTLTMIILKEILLNRDDFSLSSKELNKEIGKFEQDIINQSNNLDDVFKNERKEDLELFRFILETAWESDNKISIDEKNLIVRIQKRLGISDNEYRIIEAIIGKFPKDRNVSTTPDEINDVKKELQRNGLLFIVRDEDKIDYDIIPEEVAKTLRNIFEIEIKVNGYKELLNYKLVRNKNYLMNILEKQNIIIKRNSSLEELQNTILNYVKPSILIGGNTSRSGLNNDDLVKWLKDLGKVSNGTKDEKIQRIVEHYDNLRETVVKEYDDERLQWFEHYELFANRKLEELRNLNLIKKDLECEKKFEKATDYLFELLSHKPLNLTGIGSERPDGVLALGDKIIMWDNKSKETKVDLKDHIKQFDRYIKQSEKEVASFLVIAPDFTDESEFVAKEYFQDNDTMICLVKASDLKKVAIKWSQKNGDQVFPLKKFRQSGKFISKLVVYN